MSPRRWPQGHEKEADRAPAAVRLVTEERPCDARSDKDGRR